MRNEDIGSFELGLASKKLYPTGWKVVELIGLRPSMPLQTRNEMSHDPRVIDGQKKPIFSVEEPARNVKTSVLHRQVSRRRPWFSPWTAGSTVRLMASTSPSGQPSRKQSVTSKSKWPGFTTRVALLQPRTSMLSFIKLVEKQSSLKQWLTPDVEIGCMGLLSCFVSWFFLQEAHG